MILHAVSFCIEGALFCITACFAVQVKKVLRQQQVKPHWMFALDNLLRKAVQDAITVLLPGEAVVTDGTPLKMHVYFSV